MRIVPGLSATTHHIVAEDQLATKWGGFVPVLASPALIGLAEAACVRATDHLLAGGEISLGIGFDIQHLAPTPRGSQVTIEVQVISAEDHKITYRVSARDNFGIIARGWHVRAIVDREKFLGRIYMPTEQTAQRVT